ncbi:hypothetical protein D9757_000262 [Collybiopsis confluens]|uniref:Oxidoreductase-like domain-containing protein n=1 Tax=Collybiopsis confluens TaxID=2823264 RepID=A0A8H5I2F4_9AGAR|nr:hypothetical protein D9757_000262 [Collybiopsis confluens]
MPKPSSSWPLHSAAAYSRALFSQHARTVLRSMSTQPSLSLRAKQLSQRGGQNLTERYVRLEKNLRGRETLEAEYDHLKLSSMAGPVPTSSATPTDSTFRGLIIPRQPKEPQSDGIHLFCICFASRYNFRNFSECCMSGCAVCVYDLYEDSLVAYRDAVTKLQAMLNSMGVPEPEWPQDLRLKKLERKKDITLTVFEQMELDIKRRKQEAG